MNLFRTRKMLLPLLAGIAAVLGSAVPRVGAAPQRSAVSSEPNVEPTAMNIQVWGPNGGVSFGYDPAQAYPPFPSGASQPVNPWGQPLPWQPRPFQPPVAPPLRPLYVQVNPKRSMIGPAEVTGITATVRTTNNYPVPYAQVQIGAGGGTFSQSKQRFVHGTADGNGVFTTFWQAPSPAAKSYGMDVRARAPGYLPAHAQLTIPIYYPPQAITTPDLVIKDFIITPEPLYFGKWTIFKVGQPYIIRAVVQNIGGYSSGPQVQVSLAYLEGGANKYLQTAAYGTFSPGQSRVTQPLIFTPKFPGPHSLTFVVDPANSYQEKDESNNAWVANVTAK